MLEASGVVFVYKVATGIFAWRGMGTMSISAAMNTALSGMQAQTLRVSTAANNIANAATPGYARLSTQLSSGPNGQVSASVTPVPSTGRDGDNDVDLAGEMTDLIGASESFKANAAVFETGATIWDVLATIKQD